MAKLNDAYAQLNDEQREVFESLRSARGELQGMYQTLFNHPDLAETVSNLGTYLRFQGVLNAHDTEIAILITAREISSVFVWEQHLKAAEQAEVSAEVIEGILKMSAPAVITPIKRIQLICEVARCAARAESIPDDIANDTIARVGKAGLIEIVVIAGFYRMIASVINGFDISPSITEPVAE